MTQYFSQLETLIEESVGQAEGTDWATYELSDNLTLLQGLFDQLALAQEAFDGWEAFRKRFVTKPNIPDPPDPDDPLLAPPRNWTSTTSDERRKEKVAWQRYHYLKAKHQYETTLQTLTTQAKRHRHIISTYPNSLRGYVGYMGQALGVGNPQDSQNFFFATPRGLPIYETDRRLHTYLTGGTGTGKSENIKALVHHYLTQNTKTALVVIDPHGKLAREIARFKENATNGRLVYIKPDLKDGLAATLNPLELDKNSDDAITVQTEEVISVFRELIASGEGAAKFTTQMEVLLYPCIYTLIHMGGRNLQDLLRFMDPDQAKPFVDYALRNLNNPSHLDFFERVYPKDSYSPTRLAISTRLQSIFHSLPVSRFLIGQTSLNLGQLVENKSLIVFDLGDLGEISREAIGRFVVAHLQSYARRRGTGKTPIHLFIDEAHQFISPSLGRIMKESRKFGLHATLAQQIYGEGITPKMKEIISGNTAVKITARNSDKSLRSFAANTNTDLEGLKTLKKYQYLIQSGDRLSVKYKLNPRTLGNRHSMSKDAWKQTLKEQIQRFYRRIDLTELRKTETTSPTLPIIPDTETNPIGVFGRKPPTMPI